MSVDYVTGPSRTVHPGVLCIKLQLKCDGYIYNGNADMLIGWMQERRKYEMSMLEVLDNLDQVAEQKKRKVSHCWGSVAVF